MIRNLDNDACLSSESKKMDARSQLISFLVRSTSSGSNSTMVIPDARLTSRVISSPWEMCSAEMATPVSALNTCPVNQKLMNFIHCHEADSLGHN